MEFAGDFFLLATYPIVRHLQIMLGCCSPLVGVLFCTTAECVGCWLLNVVCCCTVGVLLGVVWVAVMEW